jgi:Spy/CpxP family protein refolding chaperone
MQRLFMKLAIVAFALSSLPVGAAASTDGMRGREDRQQARLERMRARLGLSDEQMAQVTAIFANARAQAEADRGAAGTDRQALRRLGHARHRDVQRQIQALLTPEQKARHEELRREQRARVDERKRHYDEATTRQP